MITWSQNETSHSNVIHMGCAILAPHEKKVGWSLELCWEHLVFWYLDREDAVSYALLRSEDRGLILIEVDPEGSLRISAT